ncbi:unnamed protein product, partial [Meganyctiphanes norvegica]
QEQFMGLATTRRTIFIGSLCYKQLKIKMQTVCIVIILSLTITQAYCDGVHSPDVPPHRHSPGSNTMKLNRNREVVPLKPSGTSNDRGFNFNYFFLQHSDATIINYLSQNNRRGGGQVAPPRVTSSGGGNHAEEEDHFGRLGGLFRVLARV